MPRIVPLQLLKCLRVLLDTNGGILSPTEVKRIAGLMTKYSKKLVSKCVYVQILKSTKTELLGDFMSVGGWALVCTWLSDAIRTMNWPLVQEILELLLLSPVDVNRLKVNSAPVLVKGLCKDGGNEGVRILAKRLVEQWLKIVTENPNGTPTNSPVAIGDQQSPKKKERKAAAANMGSSSSDSTDSGDGTSDNQNYMITSHERKENLVITIKTVDKSKSARMPADRENNDDDSSFTGDDCSREADQDSLDSSERSMLDSSTTESKAGDDLDKNYKSARDKNKRSEKDRDKDRKSSSSHRSSSSSHKSSSSSSSYKSSSSSSSSKSSSSSHRSSSDKHRDKTRSSSSSSSSKDKDRKEGSTSSSNKHKSSRSSSTSSSSKERSRSSTTSSSTLKDKDNKLMPPPTASPAALDKKSKEGDSELQKPKSISIPSRKASISIEIRRDTEKAATVKTYQSKFRSHGLTEEAPPPPSRKGLKKPTSTSIPATTPTLLPSGSLKRSSPPPRDIASAEKKAKIDINNVSGHVERPGAAKLIAPKKICTLVETNLFSDALIASMQPKKVVKRKKTAGSPTDKDAPLQPLKFYQDTLDESKGEDKSDDSTKENDESGAGSPGKNSDGEDDDIPLKKVKEDIEQKVQKEKAGENAERAATPEEDDTPEEPKKPGPGCGPDGPPGVLTLHRRKGPKKKLTWQTEDKLTQVRFFEVDRTERVNVTKQSFLEMKNLERYSERDALNISRRGFDDTMEAQIEWRPLVEVDNVPDHPNGSMSKQRYVQADREATTLRALYFSVEMIPPCPVEAEIEPHYSYDIPIIPFDDLTGNPDATNDYSAQPWPEPKGFADNTNEMNTFNDSNMNNMMPPGINPNMLPPNHFQPFGPNFMPNTNNMPPNPQQQMSMNMQQPGPPPIWQNQMPGNPMMNPMNVPPVGMDMNNVGGVGMPPNFMGNQFGSPGPFGGPPGFNNMNYPPMMMNGPGPNGPMMNGPNGPMPNGPMGPMGNGGPRNNNNRKNNVGGNWRTGGNNFQENSGGNWRSAGTGSNRGGGGGGGGGNTGICKAFMRGHCHMGKACKYVHPQKKRI